MIRRLARFLSSLLMLAGLAILAFALGRWLYDVLPTWIGVSVALLLLGIVLAAVAQ